MNQKFRPEVDRMNESLVPIDLEALVLRAKWLEENKDVPLVAIYQYGEVYGCWQTQLGFNKSAERKLGEFVKIERLLDEEILDLLANSVHILYKYYPNAPRAISYRKRKWLKAQLGKRRGLYRIARINPKRRFRQLLTLDDLKLLHENFGSWSNFHALANNPDKIPDPDIKHQSLNDYMEELI